MKILMYKNGILYNITTTHLNEKHAFLHCESFENNSYYSH